MAEYEKRMWDYDEVTLEPIPKDISGNKRHILVTHDESTFNANDDLKRGWFPHNEQPLKKKSKGRGIHVSDFLLDTVGRLAFPVEQYDWVNATFPLEACEIIHYGKNYDGYWTGENVAAQVR